MQIYYFYIKIAFFLVFCYEIRFFRHCCCVLDCASYFPLLGYTKYGNSRKQRKIISRFSRYALRPALGAFLRDMGGKIAGIPQCRALGTTLSPYISILYSIMLCWLIGSPNINLLYSTGLPAVPISVYYILLAHIALLYSSSPLTVPSAKLTRGTS